MVKSSLLRLFSAGIITLGCFSYNSSAQTADTKADNTKVNKQDRSPSSPTADQGKSNKSDVRLAANIRKAIHNDKSLSTYAHNVKVIAQHGEVTLKGPVRSDEEKQTVMSEAKTAAGGANVADELTVAPPKSSKKMKSTT